VRIIQEADYTVPARRTVIRKNKTVNAKSTPEYENQQINSLYSTWCRELLNRVNLALDALDTFEQTEEPAPELNKALNALAKTTVNIIRDNKDFSFHTDTKKVEYAAKLEELDLPKISARMNPINTIDLLIRQGKAIAQLLYTIISMEANRFEEIVEERNTYEDESEPETSDQLFDNASLQAVQNLKREWNSYIMKTHVLLTNDPKAQLVKYFLKKYPA